MDKFQVAHDYAMEMARQGVSLKSCLKLGWRYADAMQVEADKRKEKGFPESLKPHKHNWGSVTTMVDGVAKFVCADCGAVKHDVSDKHL